MSSLKTKKTRPFKPQIVTANALLEGDVIYLRADGVWARDLDEAAVADTPDAADELLEMANSRPDQSVGPYLVGVALDAGGRPLPDHFREAFRRTGPSNRFHGKQADA